MWKQVMRISPRQAFEHADCNGGRCGLRLMPAKLGSYITVRRRVSMQGAVSTALELPTTRRPRTNRLDRLDRAASPVVSAPIELSHEIHPVAFLDLTPAREVVEDVIPRDRSEVLCRAVN